MATQTTKKAAAPKVAKAEKKITAVSPKIGKAPSARKETTGKVKITQIVGSIGRRADQGATLIGLGLNKRHKSRVLEDTPAVRGMIYKVRHLLKVEEAN